MSRHALQKRVGWLFSSRRQQPSGQPCAAASGASELSGQAQGGPHRAAARGERAWLRRWRWHFKRGGSDPPDEQRRTPLHFTSENGHADVIRNPAGKNCQLNLADNLKRTPLMKAVQCQQEKCVALLLEHGADPNLADADGNTALHLAVLSGNTAVAGLLLEHNANIDVQNKEGYTPLNLTVSKQHEEMLECLLKEAADGHAAEQCERSALAVTTSHEADVEEENLHLQEKLERVEAENLMAALDEKEREELAAVQELQDQLSAYFKNQTTVKQLEEHVHSLEIKNTILEATVQQQSNRIEALQRDLQASASDSVPQLQQKVAHAALEQPTSQASLAVTMSHEADLEKDNLYLHKELAREVKGKYLNSERCVQNLMAALDEKEREELAAVQELQDQLSAYFKNQTTVKQLEEHVHSLEIKNTILEATVQQQSNRIEALQRDLQASASLREMEEKYLHFEHCVRDLKTALDEMEREATASAQKLQDQLAEYLETVKQLDERVQRLGFEKTSLEDTVHQQNYKIETLQRDLQATASAQAAYQDFIKQSRASHHDSLTNQLKDRIRDLEYELDRIKDTQQESTFQKQCAQAEVEKYKQLYLKEMKNSKYQAKELERANERLKEANAKLLRERHKRKSLITSSIVSGGLAATPVLYSTALGHLGNGLGLDRSLSLGGSFLSQCEKILSRKRLVASVAKVRQELDKEITKELKEATAELETGCAGSSKNLHVDQDPLCRVIEEYRDVLTKNYMI